MAVETTKLQGQFVKRIERDFIALFNCLWYRDFPITETHPRVGRADWTIHIGLVIRQCATLLGTRALFEHGGRTDAVLRFPDDEVLAHVEWEWRQAHTDINEIDKLLVRPDESAFCVFIGYSSEEYLKAALNRTKERWKNEQKTLILLLITFGKQGGARRFKELHTYTLTRGKMKKVRGQAALPWEVNRTKLKTVSDDN
ncbi:hypothetical protein [uncultured Pseudomonas sp.]|uniref:hypothetical protein n=1 Tax=uncultured Pseudomonas sp. TaxID=114707 RepID=UPI00258B293A|nr:hypothetical protein [uncultured Pseudomonas sp.]